MTEKTSVSLQSILVVDDDDKLRGLITEYLEGCGFSVTGLPHGEQFLETVQELDPSLVILDIMLPGKDGLDLLRELRSCSQAPVIMLTARGDDTDRIVGLELGADDYLPKPFNPRELLARIKAVLRRATPEAKTEPTPDLPLPVELGSKCGLVLNCQAQALLVPDEDTETGMVSVELSLTECRIMETLFQRPGRAVSRDTLMSQARGREFFAFDRSIDVHVSRLRAKLAEFPRFKNVIKTVWGTGYMFVDS